MPAPWFGVDPAAAPIAWARLIRRAYDRAADGSTTPGTVRPLVAASWDRCRAMGVDPSTPAPVALDQRETSRRLATHPISRHLDLIRENVADFVRNLRQFVMVADADGIILWSDGDRDILGAAGRANRAPGAAWSEGRAGTNAIGTALVLDHPVQIFSAEHFKVLMHAWSSSAAPVHDPETGAILAVIDAGGSYKTAHAHGLSLVSAVANMLEARLAHEETERNERLKIEYLTRSLQGAPSPSAVVNRAGRVLLAIPRGWITGVVDCSSAGRPAIDQMPGITVEPLGNGTGHVLYQRSGAEPRPTLSIRALGLNRAVVEHGCITLRLTPRQSETLVILALHPSGMEEEALANAMYGDPTKGIAVRVQISRLRRLLLPGVLRTGPYRLVADIRADFLATYRAMDRSPQPLLPSSRAPAIVAARSRLHRATSGTSHAAELVDGAVKQG